MNAPAGLHRATELAGRGAGFCSVSALSRGSSVPRRAVVGLLINERFPSGSIVQSGLHAM